tara:strand:- start:1166 stop:1711 length:546 start_codon:yes stop_codon:yes gene_type:complete
MKKERGRKRTKKYEKGNEAWNLKDSDWRCPSCSRLKDEILRFEDGKWIGGLHEHHDHSNDWQSRSDASRVKFLAIHICDQCNHADGLIKKQYPGIIDDEFSFSPIQIGMFVTASPNKKHRINYVKALEIYYEEIDMGMDEFEIYYRDMVNDETNNFAIHAIYKRMIKEGTKPSTYFESQYV